MTEKRIALYARVSTNKQDPAPQMTRLREWATKEGYTVYTEQTDVASGRLVQRKGMDEIMLLAKAHHIHAVAVIKIDRWARSVQHLSRTVAELHDLHIDFYAIDQGLQVKRSDPTSNLILNVLGAVAQWEASIISERTKDGIRDKPGRGRHRKGCGDLFPCPSGTHKKGIPAAQETNHPENGGSLNDRLISPPVRESMTISERPSDTANTPSAIQVESEQPGGSA